MCSSFFYNFNFNTFDNSEALRQEYDALKKSMRKEKEVKVESEEEQESEVLKEYKKEKVQFEEKKKTLPKKGYSDINIVLIFVCNVYFLISRH